MSNYFQRAAGVFGLALLISARLAAQQTEQADSTGFAGDNFSLEGAVELFQKAASPEDFEKLLNEPDNNVNNLDLNADGETDYIRVVDNTEGDAHALVLQAVIGEKEAQDVAVIEVEKTGDESALLQIVGDEDIFGEEKIVEPFEEDAPKKGRGGPAFEPPVLRVVVNVWGWPSVRFVYAPVYRPWVSPFRWRAYPVWYRPWRPHPFRVFYVNTRPFHRHVHVVTTHRVVRAHGVYQPHRTHSTVVRTQKTTVVKNRHGETVGKKTTTTTKVKGPRGGTATKRTTETKVKRGGRGRH